MSAGAGGGRAGMVFGLAAFGMWGLLPLYWRLLEDLGALEVLSHRMVWSLPTALVILLLVRSWSWIGPLLRRPKQLAMVALSATLISVNWGLFIWAIANDRVLESSLGYFINPLLSIAAGVLVLGERLRVLQWVAVGIGLTSVLVMSVAYGQVPWIALALSTSFAAYGLVKKQTGLDGVQGFSADTAFQFLPALGYLVYLTARGDSSFTAEGPGQALLLVASGVATALPLIFFGAAAVRLPLSTIGMMQYIAPTMMFLLGLTVFHEEMPPERWAGFLLIWAALCVLTFDALRTARRTRRTVLAHTPHTAAAPESGPQARTEAGRAG